MTRATSVPVKITLALVGAQIAVAAPFLLPGVIPSLAPHGTAYASSPCDYEDGNIDGSQCMWMDPDTGNHYSVDSRNYWHDESE